MKHRGQKVEEAVKHSNVTITDIANHCNVSRMTVYRYFSYSDLNWDRITEIYKLLDRDIHEDFPEAPGAYYSQVNEKDYEYKLSKLEKCREELMNLHKDYSNLLKSYYDLKDQQG